MMALARRKQPVRKASRPSALSRLTFCKDIWPSAVRSRTVVVLGLRCSSSGKSTAMISAFTVLAHNGFAL